MPAILFISNKYTRYYYLIINRANNRIISEYTEKHHIVPKSLGGSNQKENLVKLTGREHFICHLLLTKMTEGLARSKMIFALNCMMNRCNNTMHRHVPSSRMFETLRIKLSEAHKQLGRSKEHKSAISNAHTGKTVSIETRLRMSNSAKLNIAGAAILGSTRSIETKQKISQSRKGIVFSDEHKQKLKDAARNRKSRTNK